MAFIKFPREPTLAVSSHRHQGNAPGDRAMEWYTGPVADAVALVQRERKLLVVYVNGMLA